MFEGIIPPIVTPLTADEHVDEAALRTEVSYQLGQGVDGICVTGTTGEGNALSAEETAQVASVTVDEVAGRVPVIAGIIRNSTNECVRFGEALRDTGVAGLQVTPVHYLFTPGTDETINHYRAIAEQVGLPIVIYNVVPWAMVDVHTLRRLTTEVPEVVAVKQSGGDLHKVADLILALPEETGVLTAVDDLLYPSFVLGVDGCVAGTASLVPGLVVDLWQAVGAGDHQRARELHELILPIWRSVEGSNMPARIKECLRLQGREVGPARRPCDPVTTEQRAQIERALEPAGLLALTTP